MFQSFEDAQDPTVGAARAEHLRVELSQQNLSGFLIPRADEHQGEYVAAYAERLAWITGFSGSAGLAIVLQKNAAIFVDGRYTIQVRDQVDTSVFTPLHVIENPPEKWLTSNISKGDRIGFDPWLHTREQVKRYQEACERAGAELVATPSNPVDTIWEDQPHAPNGPVTAHLIQHAGEPAEEKIKKVQAILAENGNHAVVLTLPDSIAWLFNIRGSDISHVPVALAFAVIPVSGRPVLHIDGAKVSEVLARELEAFVDLRDPQNLEADLRKFGNQESRILVDPATAAYQISRVVSDAGAKIVWEADPCIALKACKNAFEIAGSRTAHKRDGVALCRFLHWFDQEIGKGRLDEIAVAKELELFRTETGKLRDVSFPTISAAGPNAAITHYHVTYASSRKLEKGSLYLVDSGAQYHDGTTDITRTIAIGDPTDEMRDRFTRVLVGHIAIATARFPAGTTGTQLDILARQPLWEIGLDFDHGTGHGVGSYLSVHEGPQRISKAPSKVALEPGMIISNEPGYYKEGEYGIRIENLLLVRPEPTIEGGDETEDGKMKVSGDRPMLGFETLTWAPIDLKLVDPSLMTPADAAWLNNYHAQVLENVGPRLKEPDREWLTKVTRPIKGKK